MSHNADPRFVELQIQFQELLSLNPAIPLPFIRTMADLDHQYQIALDIRKQHQHKNVEPRHTHVPKIIC